MNINIIFMSLLGLFLGYNILNYYLTPKDPYEIPTGALPVPIQEGKSKVYVSKNGDASMRTEYNRRRAIIGSNSGPIKKFGFSGSTNGSLETFFLSSIWPTLPSAIPLCTSVFEGGNAESDYCYVLDGNGDYVLVDGGYADTTVCDI
jgi:hypothetical protein